MVTISIQTEEQVLAELTEIARRRQTSVQDITQEALRHCLREQTAQSGSYTFIGIWHSGKRSLSQEAETALEQAASRREGWRLAE